MILFFTNLVPKLGITWKDGDGAKWAFSCDFTGGDIGSEKTNGENCGAACKRKSGCTRFCWTDYEGGTCWLKTGDAGNGVIKVSSSSTVCGYLVGGGGDSGKK